MRAHHRRPVVHFNVIEHPSAHRTAQPIVEAVPNATAPCDLLRDRDQVSGLPVQHVDWVAGEQQMLVIARALLGDPDVLLLDEPSEGLGPQVIEAIETVLRELTARGMAVLLVEQNIRFAFSMAHSYWVLAQGSIVFEGLNTEPEERFNLVQRRLSL